MRPAAVLALATASAALRGDPNVYSADSCSAYLDSRFESTCAGQLVNTTLAGRAISYAKAADLCLLRCVVCAKPTFTSWFVGQDLKPGASFCDVYGETPVSFYLPDTIVSSVTAAILNASAVLNNQYFLDYPGGPEENATVALASLVARLPRRDALLLLTDAQLFMDFLFENIRYALHTRAWSLAWGVTWDLFVEAVLPFAVIDEKRDLWWRPRPRLVRLLHNATLNAPNVTAAMRALADALPRAAALGLLAMSPTGGSNDDVLIPGQPFTWHSSVSPAFVSVEQVAAFGGSCTGTGVVMVAAARAIGIPARLAGCGETVVRGDDHHWCEFWDGSDPGPFGDGWHTKEGTSRGNEGGPWDSPSGPMLGCLAGVVPFSAMDSLWATSPSSAVYMPLLWSNDTFSQAWSFVGGLDRCGAYCTAWGCGPGNAFHYSQAECSQFPDALARYN